MRFRKLRIAWSVGCGIACVLLIVLWVRSYWRVEQISGTFGATVDQVTGKPGDKYGIGFGVFYGCVGAEFLNRSDRTSTLPHRPIRFTSRSTGDRTIPILRKAHPPILGFQWRFVPGGSTVYIPFWFLTSIVAIVAAISAAPWLRWRFSLRSLLIATTLVAVALGLAVWAAGK
jgi:hypothetical protein